MTSAWYGETVPRAQEANGTFFFFCDIGASATEQRNIYGMLMHFIGFEWTVWILDIIQLCLWLWLHRYQIEASASSNEHSIPSSPPSVPLVLATTSLSKPAFLCSPANRLLFPTVFHVFHLIAFIRATITCRIRLLFCSNELEKKGER